MSLENPKKSKYPAEGGLGVYMKIRSNSSYLVPKGGMLPFLKKLAIVRLLSHHFDQTKFLHYYHLELRRN